MRFGVLRTFVAAILVCAVPLRIEAEQSSLPRPQEEIMDLRLDLPGLVGKQNLPGVMNRAVSLNGHYVHDKLVRPTASLARTSSVPTLWLFGENDIRCGSPLSRQRHQPFTAASEITEHKWLPPVREHSDFLVHSGGRDGSIGAVVHWIFWKDIPDAVSSWRLTWLRDVFVSHLYSRWRLWRSALLSP